MSSGDVPMYRMDVQEEFNPVAGVTRWKVRGPYRDGNLEPYVRLQHMLDRSMTIFTGPDIDQLEMVMKEHIRMRQELHRKVIDSTIDS